MRQSVTTGTALSYEPGIKRWKEYLTTLEESNYPGEYLEKVDGSQMKAQRVVLFMAYLYMHEGMRDEQIRRAVSSVAFMFESAGTESEFFKLAIVSR